MSDVSAGALWQGPPAHVVQPTVPEELPSVRGRAFVDRLNVIQFEKESLMFKVLNENRQKKVDLKWAMLVLASSLKWKFSVV